MKSFILKPVFVTIMYIVISYSINGELCSQNIYGIQDQIGGSGSGGTSVQQSDDTMLYILGGAVIAGIVVYAMMRDKKENKTEDDSSAAFKISGSFEQFADLSPQTIKENNSMPFDLYFGLQNLNQFTLEKKYIVGVRFGL